MKLIHPWRIAAANLVAHIVYLLDNDATRFQLDEELKFRSTFYGPLRCGKVSIVALDRGYGVLVNGMFVRLGLCSRWKLNRAVSCYLAKWAKGALGQ